MAVYLSKMATTMVGPTREVIATPRFTHNSMNTIIPYMMRKAVSIDADYASVALRIRKLNHF